ncbi:MAG: hydroxymethylpyrimidine/phosphomethylpyrimidine kinase [marine bacterium B5-7]|nr:MAG: hydroxymethylpyrimidine/phosphomethylpyrimidine kinase [marine bacterium B5-7]
MTNSNNQKPVVLVIAGHDPSGGAGIQADIESIANAGCHAATVITSLTTQNTNKVVDVLPQDPEPFRSQIRLILEDMDIAACKIGMIGCIKLVEILASELAELKVPVVLDPVMSSTTGKKFSDDDICKKLLTSLLPLTTLITPNVIEATLLTQKDDLNAAANTLLNYGAKSVLITGTHAETKEVINSLYTKHDSLVEYHWERLPDIFHGSGCTLSSRIAALLALDNDLKTAVEKAQEYTWLSLKHGLNLGRGQAQPDRFYK